MYLTILIRNYCTIISILPISHNVVRKVCVFRKERREKRLSKWKREGEGEREKNGGCIHKNNSAIK